jgi:S1-C subfamily serine protease
VLLVNSHFFRIFDRDKATGPASFQFQNSQGNVRASVEFALRDRRDDLAVLRVLSPTEPFAAPAELADSDAQPGDLACTVGHPGGVKSNVVSCGQVKTTGITRKTFDSFTGKTVMQANLTEADFPTFPVNSGSGLWLAKTPGRVIFGLAAAGRAESFEEGIGDFIPASTIRALLQRLPPR